jgi:hypothetical protein
LAGREGERETMTTGKDPGYFRAGNLAQPYSTISHI